MGALGALGSVILYGKLQAEWIKTRLSTWQIVDSHLWIRDMAPKIFHISVQGSHMFEIRGRICMHELGLIGHWVLDLLSLNWLCLLPHAHTQGVIGSVTVFIVVVNKDLIGHLIGHWVLDLLSLNWQCLLPHAHTQGVIGSVTVFIVVINTKIARSRHIGTLVTPKHKFDENWPHCVCLESSGTACVTNSVCLLAIVATPLNHAHY